MTVPSLIAQLRTLIPLYTRWIITGRKTIRVTGCIGVTLPNGTHYIAHGDQGVVRYVIKDSKP